MDQPGDTPSRNMSVKDLEHKPKNLLIETIISYSVQIAHDLAKDYLTDSWRQREVAYLVICIARNLSQIKNPDVEILK